jgi:hypothetical protein
MPDAEMVNTGSALLGTKVQSCHFIRIEIATLRLPPSL